MANRYKASLTVNAPANEVFDFVSDVKNLPKYLPTTKKATPDGEDRVRVQGSANGHPYDADGHFQVDAAKHSMKWGSDGERTYSGHMEVAEAGRGKSEVTVHLQFEPGEHGKQEMAETSGSPDAAIQEGLEKALQSIQNQVEGKGGKEEPKAAK